MTAPERITASDGRVYPKDRAAHREQIRAAILADPAASNTDLVKRFRTSRDTVLDVRRSIEAPASAEAPETSAIAVTEVMPALPEKLPALPANLPAVSEAKLPVNYESAVAAITQASRIDECRAWADKAMALASYARQSRDDRLQKMAVRIQARATRRCGELLAQVESARGRNQYTREGKTDSGPIHPTDFVADGPNRADGIYAAGHDANMSTGQIKTAMRVASVPKNAFEQQVESEKPPTVTKLADQGRKPRPPVDRDQNNSDDYAAAMQAQGALTRFADYCCEHDPVQIAHAFQPHELQALRIAVVTVDTWLDRFIVSLPE